MSEEVQCVSPSTEPAGLAPSSARATASVSAAATAHVGAGGPSNSSRETTAAPAERPTSAEPAKISEKRRLLSCGWLLESFDHGYRVGRQLSRDGVHLVLTVDADAPGASLLPESALLELLKESGVVLG